MAQTSAFKVTITFQNVTTFTDDDDDDDRLQEGAGRKPIRCIIIPSKSARNLVFSISHRLLVLALRRGFLEVIGGLLSGESHFIEVGPS